MVMQRLEMCVEMVKLAVEFVVEFVQAVETVISSSSSSSVMVQNMENPATSDVSIPYIESSEDFVMDWLQSQPTQSTKYRESSSGLDIMTI
ncbi:hypothetical protein Leryth_004336 [Lithospermum erythrorhizon]|nr:hypothetical protein Leryth_004336 [Lithospermum erythrorhizon]